MPQSVATAILALVLLSSLPTGSAQVLDPALTIVIVDTPAPIGPGNSTVLNGTVSNGNPQVAAAVTLSFTAPAGWTVVLEPASAFQLAGGASEAFTATITAPADAAPTDGDLAVTATTAADQAGRTATSTATAALVFAPLPAPVVIPWYQTVAGIAAIALAIALVIGIVVGVMLRRRAKLAAAAKQAAAEAAAHAAFVDRETGITIALSSEPLQYGHKREIVYRVALTNSSRRPRVAIIDVAEITNGWRAAAQFTKVPLFVGETQNVTVVITPDAVITPGDNATVVLRVKPEEARERDERVTLRVSAPKHGVPADAHYRIVTVHREGAGAANRR